MEGRAAVEAMAVVDVAEEKVAEALKGLQRTPMEMLPLEQGCKEMEYWFPSCGLTFKPGRATRGAELGGKKK